MYISQIRIIITGIMTIFTHLALTKGNRLITLGILCTGYGLYLIKRGIDGDTLMPGTQFTYVPKWIFITVGVLLQAPLPLAYWLLKSNPAN